MLMKVPQILMITLWRTFCDTNCEIRSNAMIVIVVRNR